MTARDVLREPVPRYWCAGDAFGTRLLEAMSLLAPEVERFVIGAVRASLDRTGEAALSRACEALVREEAGHSRVHGSFNLRLARQGVDARHVLSGTRKVMALATRLSPGARLATAAACEHLSAVLSLTYLRAARRLEIRPARIAELFEGHARDELGHRAVVFDLLKSTGGGTWPARTAALAAVTLAGAWCAVRLTAALLRHDGPGRGTMLHLAGKHGWLPRGRFLLALLSFARPGFHPSQLPGG